MCKILKGRPLIPGKLKGEALVSTEGFNAYASFYNCLSGAEKIAVCADSGNRELFGKQLDGKILCIPKTIGSTSAGAVWHRTANLGLPPIAVLFSQSIDSLAAGGLIVTYIWSVRRIVTIDQLGAAMFEHIRNGTWLEIFDDGSVIINGEKLIN
ncbi:hypothetical protein AMJ86_03290 [bacterium SM23_57]|nr:MAG: hypothetical protein AMJ86_03290 [bacterium SM23_57]